MLALAAIASIGLPQSAKAFFCFSFSIGGGPRISYFSRNLTGPFYGPMVDYPSMSGLPGGWSWPGYGGNRFATVPAFHQPSHAWRLPVGGNPYGYGPYSSGYVYSPYGYSGYQNPYALTRPYGISPYAQAYGYPIGWGAPLGGLAGYPGVSRYGLGLPW